MKIMKKFLLLSLMMAIVSGNGCSPVNQPEPPDPSQTSVTTSPASTTTLPPISSSVTTITQSSTSKSTTGLTTQIKTTTTGGVVLEEGYIGNLDFSVVTGYDDQNRQMVLNTQSILLLVNKVRNLSSTYVPGDLTKPSVRFTFSEDVPRRYMRYNAAKALEKLFSAASDAGYKLYGVSGYRSYATQKAIFDKRAAERGEEVANKTSARPGQSEHQTGLAMDISSKAVDYRLVTSFGDTAEGKWVKKNAHRFGFIIRYPKGKETITGYSYEPWHLRYVGITAAKYIYEHGLTLEEYFYQVHNYPQP
jgi:LAS superfamily LD-carboxypeptidase LdcB